MNEKGYERHREDRENSNKCAKLRRTSSQTGGRGVQPLRPSVDYGNVQTAIATSVLPRVNCWKGGKPDLAEQQHQSLPLLPSVDYAGLHKSCTDAQICAGRLGPSRRKVRSKTTRQMKLN